MDTKLKINISLPFITCFRIFTDGANAGAQPCIIISWLVKKVYKELVVNKININK